MHAFEAKATAGELEGRGLYSPRIVERGCLRGALSVRARVAETVTHLGPPSAWPVPRILHIDKRAMHACHAPLVAPELLPVDTAVVAAFGSVRYVMWRLGRERCAVGACARDRTVIGVVVVGHSL